MTDDTHTCPGYTCERPECVRRQRDELREALKLTAYEWRTTAVIGCKLCFAAWDKDRPPQHAEGCLAA